MRETIHRYLLPKTKQLFGFWFAESEGLGYRFSIQRARF
jgi:hypothetical protein